MFVSCHCLLSLSGTVAVCAIAFVPGLTVTAEEAPSPEQIAGWVELLGSPQFSQRETATRSLIAAGPAALAPLHQAIRGGDLEVSSRAIEIARGILADEDPEAAATAEQFLQSLAEDDDASVARLAEATLDFHAMGIFEETLAKLEALGATMTRGLLPTGQHGRMVLLNASWRGTSADLRLLVRIPELIAVSLHGVKVDGDAVATLGRLRSVARLELYGTGADDKQLATLAGKLPDTKIEVRKGGKLGVGGQPTVGPCLITQVQPDSAADKAGIQVGDIVVKVDGEPVANFEALTDRVGTRGPGEKVDIEIVRGLPGGPPESLTRTIELDAW